MRWLPPVLLLGLVLSTPARGASSTAAPANPSGSPLSDAVLADLPFLPVDEPNRIVVDLAPDGSPPLRLLLDTGASDSVLTPRYARRLGVSIRRERSTPYRRATRLGRDLQFWVDTQSSDTASRTGWEYGLLGGTFLRQYVVELDFAAHRVRLLDPQRYEVPQKTGADAVLPLEIIGNRPLVDLSIAGQTVRLMLDTGDWDTAVVSGSIARMVRLETAALAGLRAGSVWGPVDVEFAEAPSVRVGPFELSNVPVLVAPNGLYNLGPSTDSVIGYDILSQFIVRIDYPRRRLWLRRRPNVDLTFAGVSYAAQRAAGLLVWSEQRGLRVEGIFPGSPASRLGIRRDDVVVPVGGQTAPGFEAATLGVIAHGGAVTVSRRIHGAWIDVPLPSVDPGD